MRTPPEADERAARVKPAHRPDIQGIRGLAVLLVVICHAGIALPGGFVGVDVFFVVSGFVIARELIAELEATGTVAIGAFYARRARRLLPTLAVVTVATLGASLLVLSPFGPLQTALRTAAASSVFGANAYLYRHAGYFDSWADGANPFLHLWSLAVEEQFYLVLPAALLWAWRAGKGRGRSSSVALVVLGSAVSLWLSWAMTTGRSPIPLQAPGRFAFFSPFTRAWELGAGVVLALLGRRGYLPGKARASLALAGALAGAGALAIALTATLLDPLDPFPGLAALPPVLGTVGLIVGGAGSPLVAGVLGWRPLRWLGDRSYAWYLWHWPAMALARVLWPGGRWPPVAAGLVGLALAALGYRLFEDRIRKDRTRVGRRAVALAAVCITVPLVAMGLASAGVDRGLGLDEPEGWYDYPEGRNVGCVLFNRDLANTWPESACTTPGAPGGPVILVLGDRAADGVSTAVIDVARARGLGVAEWARAGCPFVGRSPYGYPRCTSWQREAMRLVDRLEPAAVVIANRGPDYVDGVRDDTTIVDAVGDRPDSRAEALRSWGEALHETLDALDRRGIPAVVVGSVPDHGTAFPRARYSVLHPSTRPPVLRRADVVADRRAVLDLERAVVARHPDAVLVDPVPSLCGPRTCPSFQGGRWLYYEPQDLTQTGSRLLVPSVAAALDDVWAG